jgi:hypothetical protein
MECRAGGRDVRKEGIQSIIPTGSVLWGMFVRTVKAPRQCMYAEVVLRRCKLCLWLLRPLALNTELHHDPAVLLLPQALQEQLGEAQAARAELQGELDTARGQFSELQVRTCVCVCGPSFWDKESPYQTFHVGHCEGYLYGTFRSSAVMINDTSALCV